MNEVKWNHGRGHRNDLRTLRTNKSHDSMRSNYVELNKTIWLFVQCTINLTWMRTMCLCLCARESLRSDGNRIPSESTTMCAYARSQRVVRPYNSDSARLNGVCVHINFLHKRRSCRYERSVLCLSDANWVYYACVQYQVSPDKCVSRRSICRRPWQGTKSSN